MISGAEKSAADCTRRSPDSAPLDAGSIPAISTYPMWARPRRLRAAGPLSCAEPVGRTSAKLLRRSGHRDQPGDHRRRPFTPSSASAREPGELADALRTWSLSRSPGGFASRPDLRKHVKRGLRVARLLVRHLGPSWAVRYWDERHRTAKWVCWGCDGLHWERDSQGARPRPVDITVEGEYAFGPLRAEGFGDFFPDDPAAARPARRRLRLIGCPPSRVSIGRPVHRWVSVQRACAPPRSAVPVPPRWPAR